MVSPVVKDTQDFCEGIEMSISFHANVNRFLRKGSIKLYKKRNNEPETWCLTV